MKTNTIHKIVQGDCLEKMKLIPDNFIDFICSDFPYNISNNHGLTMRGNKVVRADFWEWDKWDNQEDYLKFVFDVCREYKRILKPNASMILFFSYRYSWWIGYELERMGLFTFRVPIVLSKMNPLPSFKQNGFRSCYEIGLWLTNDDWRFKRPRTFNFTSQREMKNVLPYLIGKDGNKQTQHPTEKPEWIIGQFIKVFTNPWEIVLDSFAGGWTTGVASYKLWRNCISIEKESGFIAMIKKRQMIAERG
jgi:modification methylase